MLVDDAVTDILSVVVVSREKVAEDSGAVLVLDSIEVLSVVVIASVVDSIVVRSVVEDCAIEDIDVWNPVVVTRSSVVVAA